MKLLLTGLPKAGKTTLIREIIAKFPKAFWVVCGEILDDQGERIGFKAETSTGLQGVIAHKTDIDSNVMMGSYRVDIAEVDRLLSDPIKEACLSDQLMIVDEIGRMQILSSKFAEAARAMLLSNNPVLATIRYGDEWTEEYTGLEGVETVTMTEENRAEMREKLLAELAGVPS